MAQRKNRRSHRSSGAAAGLTGPATGSCLHSVHGVDAHSPVSHDSGSIWNRRRVLLLNSTYEPLTALPVRRAIIMLICAKADVVHDDPSGPVIHSATRSIAVPSVI
ncbi:MAG: HNH endonuclease, partial [Mycobacterium sp.]